MSVEQFTAVLVSLAGLVAAVTALLVQVRATHQLVNSRMTELLEATRSLATMRGAESERQRGLNPPGEDDDVP